MDATPIAKILPRSPTDGVIVRAALEQLVSTARTRRLTVVVAEAGFGKSTLLASWWEQAPCAWYTADQRDLDLPTLGRQLSDALRLRVADILSDMSWLAEGAVGPELEQFLRADALAAQLAEILHAQLTTDLILVIDDAHELAPASPSARLIEALCRHAPPRLHLVISGRRQPPFQIERLRGQGHLLEIDGGQLAFTIEEVGELVERQLATRRLLRRRSTASPVDGLRDLVSRLALFERFTPELTTSRRTPTTTGRFPFVRKPGRRTSRRCACSPSTQPIPTPR